LGVERLQGPEPDAVVQEFVEREHEARLGTEQQLEALKDAHGMALFSVVDEQLLQFLKGLGRGPAQVGAELADGLESRIFLGHVLN
jgi:hypothetical protein